MESDIFNSGNIKKFYKFDKILGEYPLYHRPILPHLRGSFAVVRKGIRKSTHEEVAIKIIDK